MLKQPTTTTPASTSLRICNAEPSPTPPITHQLSQVRSFAIFNYGNIAAGWFRRFLKPGSVCSSSRFETENHFMGVNCEKLCMERESAISSRFRKQTTIFQKHELRRICMERERAISSRFGEQRTVFMNATCVRICMECICCWGY